MTKSQFTPIHNLSLLNKLFFSYIAWPWKGKSSEDIGKLASSFSDYHSLLSVDLFIVSGKEDSVGYILNKQTTHPHHHYSWFLPPFAMGFLYQWYGITTFPFRALVKFFIYLFNIIYCPPFSLGLKRDYTEGVSTNNKMGRLINHWKGFGLQIQPDV